MLNRGSRTPVGAGSRLWPMLSILLLVVLVPTACMLWFLTAAMRNTSLAVRQRLTEVYRGQVLDASRALEEHWGAQLAALNDAAALAAPERFRRLVTSTDFDAVVIRGEDGRLSYPAAPAPGPDALEDNPAWAAARALEYERTDANAAASAYADLAGEGDETARARALRAQARCLAKAARTDEAVKVLAGPLAEKELAAARDAGGRLIAPDAMLFALELLGDPNAPLFRDVAAKLRRRLDDYRQPVIPSSQRLFLMGELRRLADVGPFDTEAAERCAGEYLDAPQPPAGPDRLSKAAGKGLWHVASRDGRTVAVCRRDRLARASQKACATGERLTGITVRVQPPGEQAAGGEAFLTIPAPEPLVGWQLAAWLVGEDPFSAAAGRQKAAYMWAAGLGITVILTAALVMAAFLSRQARLARLKNDLIATVSHELKTPLSSMRVLIDTLVEGRCRDERQAGEYYGMIARENERLSRVIDNFLTFSRMERKGVAFDFAAVDVAEAVAAAAESVRERFSRPGCELSVDVAPHLPAVHADRDALVTVLLNLLDNAYKYTPDDKRISLRAWRDGGEVCLAVRDNGVGLSRRAARRAFDRFYQVDQRLSRAAGGCGLGLSIVKFIVDAHGGSIDVTSRAGEGSTFTVRLPAGAESKGRQTSANPRAS